MTMIKINKPDTSKAVDDVMTLNGTEFPITLLPLEQKDFFKKFNAFRRRKNAYNPVTKLMDLQTYFDDEDPKYISTVEDLLDAHVLNFHGISIDGETELDGTKRENKILLGSIRVEDNEDIPLEDPQTKEKVIITQKRERPFSALIFDKCMELAKVTAKAEIKN
jgi:hypothetical protein